MLTTLYRLTHGQKFSFLYLSIFFKRPAQFICTACNEAPPTKSKMVVNGSENGQQGLKVVHPQVIWQSNLKYFNSSKAILGGKVVTENGKKI